MVTRQNRLNEAIQGASYIPYFDQEYETLPVLHEEWKMPI